MKNSLVCLAIASLLCGCASGRPQESASRRIYERPWVGGVFESAPAPELARQHQLPSRGALVTRAFPESPLARDGVSEGDLVLAIDGRHVNSAPRLRKRLEDITAAPVTFTVYRDGGIHDVRVTPGIERYHHIRHIWFGVGYRTTYELDFYPDPGFNIIAVGFKPNNTREDLTNPKIRYRDHLRLRENSTDADVPGDGVNTDEGWKAWLGPFGVSRHNVIVSQQAAP